VLATQNPVDLDYKGLANTGTWFIGRLQTERDKARVLEGLEGASSSAGIRFDKGRLEQLLAGLGNRIFLMNNVHEDEPVVFETRWCLSYLRGPLTRTQIKQLMDPGRAAHQAKGAQAPTESMTMTISNAKGGPRPILAPDVPQYVVPLRSSQPEDSELVYVPMLLGAAQVRFADAKSGIDVTEDVTALVPLTDSAVAVDWDHAVMADMTVADLERTPVEPAQFLLLPPDAYKAKSYVDWNKDFGGWLFRTHKLMVLKSSGTKEISKPDESERDFRLRLQQSSRERRDQAMDRLRQSYAPKIAAIQERIRRALQMKERQQVESRSSQIQAAITVGASILGAFLGRKTISATNIGRATTAIRSAGRVMKESQEVGHAEDNVAVLQQQLTELQAQFQSESEALTLALDPLNEPLETLPIRPAKANIVVKLVALAWTPEWRSRNGMVSPAWQ
jgi:hypothetical protein